MSEIIINRKNRTIVVEKSFEKKASVYGSEEYNKLTTALRDNTGFRLVVKNHSKDTRKTLSYEGIRLYLTLHGEAENLRLLEDLRKIGISFQSIKKWFLDKHPDFDWSIDESVIAHAKNNSSISNAV